MNKLTPLQTALLNMFEWLTKFLEEQNIRYYIIGGTLLGACRHNGFIPWDDDIDIGIPREDYERLLKLFDRPIDHYVLESYHNGSKHYFLTFSKIYDMNTTMTLVTNKPITRGVFIDIFPLDGAGNTNDEIEKQAKVIFNRQLFMGRYMIPIDKKYGIKNLLYILCKLIPVNVKKYLAKSDSLAKKYSFSSCDYVANFGGSYGRRETMPKRYFGEPQKYRFEHLMVYGPAEADLYLKHVYNDWQKLPPVEKRQVHNLENIDLSHPFSQATDVKDILK